MSFSVTGHVDKASIEAEVSFVSGDLILCEPGNGFCGSIILRGVTASLVADGFFEDVYNISLSPGFGVNEYALPTSIGHVATIHEEEGLSYGELITITHPSDPLGIRFVEAWVTYYPSSGYVMSYESYDSNSLATSAYVALKPLIYPELLQTLSIPGAGAMLTSSLYKGIQGSFGGEYIVIYSSSRAAGYRWNGTTYEELFIHQTGSIYCASISDSSAVIIYLENSVNKIAVYEDLGTWTLDRIEPWNYSLEEVMLSGDYIITGGSYSAGTVLHLATLSVYYIADDAEYLDIVPSNYKRYRMYTGRVHGYSTTYESVLGGPLKQIVGYTEMTTSSSDFKKFGSIYAEGPSPYRPPGEDNVGLIGSMLMSHPIGYGPDDGIAIKTTNDQVFPFSYLNTEYNASLDLTFPTASTGYIFDEFLVNFSGQVLMAVSYTEAIPLYAYDFSTHKVFGGIFHPVKYPYYATSSASDTVDIIEVIKTHYDEVAPAVVTLRCNTVSAISATNDFEIAVQPAGTVVKFLLSSDNVTFYKWDTSAWVAESDISNGNSAEDFTTGCQSGFTFPADSFSAFIKIQLSSSVRDLTPVVSLETTKLYLTTISSENNAYLCDDSKVRIEHTSDTETSITSLIPQDVILAAQVTIIAPAYSSDYEG